MISIVIPTFNEESVLQKTLEHIRTLKKIPYEIIVSDGRSIDATQAIAAKLATHVVIYAGEARQTIAQARNLGAKAATGDYFVFIDADTEIPEPDSFFTHLIKIFEQDTTLAGVTVSIRVRRDQDVWQDRPFFAIVNLVHRFYNNVLQTGSASGEFQMVRRAFFEKIGGFNDALVTYEDNDLFERLAKIGKIRMLPEYTIFHSGRRAHKVGHIRLLSIWMINTLWFKLFHKAFAKEWTPIR